MRRKEREGGFWENPDSSLQSGPPFKKEEEEKMKKKRNGRQMPLLLKFMLCALDDPFSVASNVQFGDTFSRLKSQGTIQMHLQLALTVCKKL